MNHPVKRLEQALRHWEDTCFVLNGLARIHNVPRQQVCAPGVHYKEFRTYLLNVCQTPFDYVDFWNRFIGSNDEFGAKEFDLSGSAFRYLPSALDSWTRSSRRVFVITKELQYLLDSTSLEGVTWGDVAWPFPSFVVVPEVPLVDDKRNRFDCLLVSSEFLYDGKSGDQKHTAIRFFSQGQDKIRPIHELDKETIEKLFRRGEKDLARRKIQHQVKTNLDAPGVHSSVFYLRNNIANREVTESLSKSTVVHGQEEEVRLFGKLGEHPYWDEAARLIVGLCLYLSTLPPGAGEHRSEWKPLEGKKSIDKGSVVRESEVCTVSNVYKLTPQERNDLAELEAESNRPGGYELRAHFRRGHWRRPAGQGHDPNAKRIIWVRPTLVRRDRLPTGGLPGGSGQVLG